ncbi:hypothetical protein K0U83_06090 [bacterium]|nr:hypothetical protein [bacterium]
MAYSATGLVTVASSKRGNGPSMYLYKTADTQATVNTAGYFNALSSMLEVGDIIFVYDTTTPSLVLTYVVSNASGVVDIADGTTVSATDTD